MIIKTNSVRCAHALCRHHRTMTDLLQNAREEPGTAQPFNSFFLALDASRLMASSEDTNSLKCTQGAVEQ